MEWVLKTRKIEIGMLNYSTNFAGSVESKEMVEETIKFKKYVVLKLYYHLASMKKINFCYCN